jgi:hypothetical protein
MSDEHLDDIDLETSEEYEEITSDEVDSVVEELEALAERVSSENIQSYLEQACQQIHELVYDEEDEEDDATDNEEELLSSDIDSDDPLTDEDDLAAEAA